MPNVITARIDVTLIDKARFFPGKKLNRAGKMPQYLGIVLLPSRNSDFGDTHMIVQSVRKEEREAGTRGAILGNATEKVNEGEQQAEKPFQGRSYSPATERQQANLSDDVDGDDVPF